MASIQALTCVDVEYNIHVNTDTVMVSPYCQIRFNLLRRKNYYVLFSMLSVVTRGGEHEFFFVVVIAQILDFPQPQ